MRILSQFTIVTAITWAIGLHVDFLASADVLTSKKPEDYRSEIISSDPIRVKEIESNTDFDPAAFLFRVPASAGPEDNLVPPGFVEQVSPAPASQFEAKRRVSYCLEMRTAPSRKEVPVRFEPEDSAKEEFRMKPGQMVCLNDSEEDYLLKMRGEQRNEGAWLVLPVKGLVEGKELYFYYDFRDFETITPYHLPVQLGLSLQTSQKTVKVFSRAGEFPDEKCGATEKLCKVEIDNHAEIFLVGTQWLKVESAAGHQEWKLYYHIGYIYRQPERTIRAGQGWISNAQAQRQISKLQPPLFANRMPQAEDFRTTQQERADLTKLFVFGNNLDKLDVKENRFLRNKPPEKIRYLASVYDIMMAWELGAGASYYEMSQSDQRQLFQQWGTTLRFGGAVPLFLDVELSGNIQYTVPISSTPESGTPPVLKMEQWLTYISPWKIADHPLRFGVGGYFITMSSNYLGFQSLLGIHMKALYETDDYYVFGRVGPIGDSLNFVISNRELGGGLGYYLSSENRSDGWSIYSEYSNIEFTSSRSLSIKYNQVQLGLMMGF